MGYDMYIVAEDATEEAASRAADAMIDAAAAARDALERDDPQRQGVQHAIDAMLARKHRLPCSYFRLNVWGMARAADAMERLGMLDLGSEQGVFPDAEGFGVTGEMWEFEDGDPAMPEPRKRFDAACAAVTDAQAEKPTGIPAYKFGTNDGWLATPGELAAALAAYDEAVAGGASVSEHEWWGDWIDYLRRAQGRGGFRVH